MSEFPEWIEEGLGLSQISHKDALELHRAMEVVRRYRPDVDRILAAYDERWPSREKYMSWGFWKRLQFHLKYR